VVVGHGRENIDSEDSHSRVEYKMFTAGASFHDVKMLLAVVVVNAEGFEVRARFKTYAAEIAVCGRRVALYALNDNLVALGHRRLEG
jgi:hypothetical protein